MIRSIGIAAFLVFFAFPALVAGEGEDAGAPQQAEAQEAAEPEPEIHPLILEAERIDEALTSHLEEGKRVRTLVRRSEGEDAEALRRQAEEIGLAGMRELGRFVDNLLARERAGFDAAESRERAQREIRPLGRRIETTVVEATEVLGELRDQRETVDAEDRAELEDRIAARTAWLDAVYNALAEHARALERLDIDAQRERDFLGKHLKERSVLLGGRLRIARERVAKSEEKVERDPEDDALMEELLLEQQQLEVTSRSLRKSIELMNEIGLDTTDARQLLIETTGDFSFSLLDREVLANLIRDGWDRVREVADEVAPEVTVRLVRFLSVIVLFWILAKITRFAVRRAATSSRFDISVLLQNMLMSLASRIVMILGFLLAFAQVGVEIAPLLAGLGIAGFIVGFALQDTLSNFASGAMILLYRPFDTGDVVDAAGVFGKVHDMSLVSTTLLTFDNQTLVVPNSKIWGNVITNLTLQRQRRVDLEVRVGYDEDVERVIGILLDLVTSHPKTLDDPAPIIEVNDLSDAGVVIIVRPWTATADYWSTRWELLRQIKQRLDREGVEIAVPQRLVRLRCDEPDDAASSETST